MQSSLSKFNKLEEEVNIDKIKSYADLNGVPIISDQGLMFLLQMIRVNESINILEIGTAIGYSAINMANISKSILIDTIERDAKMYDLAIQNINDCNLQDRIKVYYADALNIDLSLLKSSYDLIFIDAAKAQYINFFEKFSKLLSPKGIIISDNLMFHGLVEGESHIESRNLRALVRKIHNYNLWLSNHSDFVTLFLEIGDGMALSKKK